MVGMQTTNAPTTKIFSKVTAKLLHRTTFMMDKFIEKLLSDQAGITLSQFLMLMQVAGGKQCQRELATALGVTPAAVSRQVAQMTAAGYIKRLSHEHDRRFEYLALTAQGRKTYERASQALESGFADVYEGLSSDEQRAIHESLSRLMQCYEKGESRHAPPSRIA